MALLLMVAPSLATAQTMRFAGPYPIDQQAGETLAAAIHRAQRMERLHIPPYYAWPNIPAPLLHGTITDGLNFAYVPDPPTGTWTIFDYWVCDVAKNCLVDETPSDIQALFGTTTFTVTQ